MAKILRLAVLVGLCTFAFSLTAHAQVVGICAGWVTNSSSYCTPASSTYDIGTTMNSNPTFNVALNGSSGATTTSTEIVVLVPSSMSGTLSFTATFTPSGGGSGVTVSASVYPNFNSSSGSLVTFLGFGSVPGAQNYKFNNINAVSTIPGVTGYTAYVFDASSLGLTGGSGYITVSFNGLSDGSGLPPGTIILAFGNDASGNIVYFTPLTDGLQTTVPEPMTLGLFGTGLLGIALMMRRRMRKQEQA